MAAPVNVYTLLKFYLSKQRTYVVEFGEFAEYLKRYAQHHNQENPELYIYAGSDTAALQEELENLSGERLIVLATQGGKQYIYLIAHFIDLYKETYMELETKFNKPFPCVTDLPRNVPSDIVTKQSGSELLFKLFDEDDANDKTLYCVTFSKGLPGLLLPSNVSVLSLVSISLKKIQDLLRKGETHDYFLKKLTISNPGKELSIKNFFTKFVSRPEESWEALKTSGDTFYYWNQLGYFVRQDYNKVKDFTSEDINVLLSISILEIAASYYKQKAGARMVKDAAFKVLDEILTTPPYYFSMLDIGKLKDENGDLIVSKFTDEDLKKHMADLTSEVIGEDLPRMLIFKIEGGEHYFIYREKVMPLLVRLANDARGLIRESLSKVWYEKMLAYQTLPEMKESQAFEKCLERELKECSPVLYALLHAAFLPVLAVSDHTPGRIPLYRDGLLIPYSELLLVSRQEIYSEARVKLPFWYTMPIISWILTAIKNPKKKRKADNTAATTVVIQEEKDKANKKVEELDANDSLDPKKSRKRELRKAAGIVEKKLVPESSTLDRELESYMREWNDRISKKAHDDLEEDINNLIRDYVRKTLRSLKISDFTEERVSSLASALVDSPSLMKVKNPPALKHYVELYMVKLIKNLP